MLESRIERAPAKTGKDYDDIIWALKNVRVTINAGTDKYGLFLGSKACRNVVGKLDKVILQIMEMRESEDKNAGIEDRESAGSGN